jgi:hypothetical protein
VKIQNPEGGRKRENPFSQSRVRESEKRNIQRGIESEKIEIHSQGRQSENKNSLRRSKAGNGVEGIKAEFHCQSREQH